MRELPTVLRDTSPAVERVLSAGYPSVNCSGDLERLMQVRELQASYVYATVLAKKFKVLHFRSVPCRHYFLCKTNV